MDKRPVEDELMVDVEDIFEDEDEDEEDEDEPQPAPVLKLSSPTIAPQPVPVNYAKVLALAQNAGSLFDFKKTKLNPIQQIYIVGFATKGTRKGACELAGVSYNVVNKWLENDEFARALQTAVDIVRDSFEEELFARAMSGSDKLLLEAVKAMKPEKYNKKQSEVNVTGNVVHTWADLAKQVVVEADYVIEKTKKGGKKSGS